MSAHLGSGRIASSIPWDVYEEHLEEAGWLWKNWEEALDSAVYALGDVVVGPEERLLAHLDGLVLGGAHVAQKLLLPMLESDDRGALSAAVWALAQSEDGDHQDALIATLTSAEPPAQSATARALSLSPRVDLRRVVALWPEHSAPVRAVLLDAFGARDPAWRRDRLDDAIRSEEPALIAAALRAVSDCPEPAFLGPVEEALRSDDPDVRAEAFAAGIMLGSKAAWTECRRACNEPGDLCRLPLGLMAISPDPNDRAFVGTKVRDPAAARHALWALGFAGDVEAAETILVAMADEQMAKIAGEAFSATTGLAMAGQLVATGESARPDVEEVAEDAPPPVVRSEEFLPRPKLEAVTKWWHKRRSHFVPGSRYVYGHPRSSQTLHLALTTTPTWRLGVLRIELGAASGRPPVAAFHGWARDRRHRLRQGGV